jgi:hypothetical protein
MAGRFTPCNDEGTTDARPSSLGQLRPSIIGDLVRCAERTASHVRSFATVGLHARADRIGRTHEWVDWPLVVGSAKEQLTLLET